MIIVDAILKLTSAHVKKISVGLKNRYVWGHLFIFKTQLPQKTRLIPMICEQLVIYSQLLLRKLDIVGKNTFMRRVEPQHNVNLPLWKSLSRGPVVENTK